MDDHACRLVDGQEVIVLIQNIEGYLLRRHIGDRLPGDLPLYLHAFLQAHRGFGPPAIHAHVAAVDHLFHLRSCQG
jgi:hypothetical protein